MKNGLGPGHSIATLDHVHADSIPWGGGVIVDLMSVLPLTSATDPASGVPRWGAAHKQWMRVRRPYAFGVFGMGQEIPKRDLCCHPRRRARPMGQARSPPAQERPPGFTRGRGRPGRLRNSLAARRRRTGHPPSARRAQPPQLLASTPAAPHG